MLETKVRSRTRDGKGLLGWNLSGLKELCDNDTVPVKNFAACSSFSFCKVLFGSEERDLDFSHRAAAEI